MPQGRIGTTVKEQRERREMSISRLARDTGLSRSGLRRIERGERQPSLSTISKLAQALDVLPSTLLEPLDTEEVDDEFEAHAG